VRYCFLDTPIGSLLLAGDDAALHFIGFPAQKPQPGWIESPARGVLAEAAKQLREYFAGERTRFGLPLAPKGTSFQRSVWSILEAIPYGETISYAELAQRVGNPKAARAVGSANGKNCIPIVIPCHRVIASDGTLGGFGGGLPTKAKLLELERAVSSK
jgi:methylated-DNA-[protein]-cysteine S-methyltransferase